MYALSVLFKRTTPLVKSPSAHYIPVMACHTISSRSFVNSMMMCKHACGSTTGLLGVICCGTEGLSLSRVRAYAPLVQYIFAVVVKKVAYTRFRAGKDIIDALMHLRNEVRVEGSNRWRARPSDIVVRHV